MSKPMIRHCYNCEYCTRRVVETAFGDRHEFGHCDVTYRNKFFPRLSAKLCKFYKQRGIK